ncbi:uncharacterized protein EKO05_0001117 [Ascochyta rabiei]|uniref:Uncharacterized protein n=1 Tax=Didymella rabiei TaxID=5454 RepID=A0A162YR01_DIDRA|nr:uncharacterized protein EKO05_0001117 [Ascochyta rabiei]KZM20176.1 hypothetical protein ST47_g8664 [Ascochyta rabiei]UPX10458.1 hypothetical protein EKO05_0001117 [Ascochyta rabiei]
MPAVPELLNAIAQLGNVAPRAYGSDSLLPHGPAIDVAAMRQDAPRTIPIAKRQQMVVQQGIIPTYYNLSGPQPGTVVGIVLGSVGGFLLIVWLLYSLTNSNGAGTRTTMAGEEEIVVRKRRNSHGNRSRRNSHAQMREVSRSPRQSSGRSHIIVEERRQPPPPQQRTRSIIVEERRRVPNDDVVEVIEEHDEYRERRGSRRGGYR